MNTLDRMAEFVAAVRALRDMQREYRRTQDSTLRNQLPAMEATVDGLAVAMSDELAQRAAELSGTEAGAA